MVKQDDENAAKPELTGQLYAARQGHEWTIVCENSLVAVRNEAANQGLTVIEADIPSLEDIFLARVAPAPKEAMAS